MNLSINRLTWTDCIDFYSRILYTSCKFVSEQQIGSTRVLVRLISAVHLLVEKKKVLQIQRL